MRRLLALMAFLPGLVLAGTLTVTVGLPVKNTDGSSIPASGAGSVVSSRVEYGSCNGSAFGTKAGEFILTMPTVTGPTPDLQPGTYCLRAYHKNTFAVESDPTLPVQGTVAPPKPNPGTLTVTVPVAFKMRQGIDGYEFVSIGTVPVGTACDGTHSVDGKYLVPRANVTLTSRFDTMPLVVFATCG